MDDSLQQSAQTTHDLTTSARSKRLLRRVFVGNHGIRWPWRIALFIATFLGVAFGMAKLLHYVFGPIPNSESLLTLLPFYLDANTKLFLVALLWCRPWLVDPARGTPLPRTPEIARAALVVTDAHHELDSFDSDPAFRDRLSARVGEHLKVLRRKITERGMVRPGVRLSDEVAVGALLEHGIITSSDLDRLADPAWCSRQEDLWWTPVL